MTPRRHLADLDLRAVLAPFDDLAGRVAISIEDADGRCLSMTAPAAHPEACVSQAAPIQVHDEVAGRVILTGPAQEAPLLTATAGAIASALSIAVSAGISQSPATTAAIDEELAHGRRLQRSFVSMVPPDVPGFAIAAHYEAAREVGGDFFDLFRLRRRGRPLSLVIADVTGKGIAAALLMAFARPLLHAAIDQTSGPTAALERTNQILVGERRTTLFITALCARLDVATGRIQMANAGHEPPLFIPADGSPPGLVLGSGPLLGAFATLRLPSIEATMLPGDTILFYTDGVTDARAQDGTRFDESGLLAAVERARGGTPQDLVTEITSAVDRFVAGADPADDITMVALTRLPRR
jgi:sigma-B regulation protein RsbU (phosphoserine phosphatase)